MSTDAEKPQLLEQFQAYLEQTSIESVITAEQPDLHTLLSEMVGLKTEVKTQARQFKNTLDTLSSALATVQENNKLLAENLIESRQQQDEIQKTLLLEFIDIYDRVKLGSELLQNYRPVKSLFKNSRKRDVKVIKQFQQGQNMSLRRFEQLLQRYQVRAIECVGMIFDPAKMNVIEIGNEQTVENGIVLEELRAGFVYKDQVLRLAEVKVNKVD